MLGKEAVCTTFKMIGIRPGFRTFDLVYTLWALWQWAIGMGLMIVPCNWPSLLECGSACLWSLFWYDGRNLVIWNSAFISRFKPKALVLMIVNVKMIIVIIPCKSQFRSSPKFIEFRIVGYLLHNSVGIEILKIGNICNWDGNVNLCIHKVGRPYR